MLGKPTVWEAGKLERARPRTEVSIHLALFLVLLSSFSRRNDFYLSLCITVSLIPSLTGGELRDMSQ